MQYDNVTQAYTDALNILKSLDTEDMMVVAAALKTSADTIYAIKTMNDEKLKNMPTGGVQ